MSAVHLRAMFPPGVLPLMSLWSRIFKNTIALAIPNILNPFVSFALVLVISRYMGVEGLGGYSLVFSYIGIFKTLASLGLADLIAREVARRPEEMDEYLLNSISLGVAASIISMLSMDALIAAMGYDAVIVEASVIYSLSIVASTAIYYFDAVFRAAEKSHYIALTYTPENLVRVAVCVALILSGYGLVALFAAMLATRVLALVLMAIYYVREFGVPRWRFRPEIWSHLLRQAPTFTSIVIFSTIHLSLDTIMLSKLKGVDSVGIYSAAHRLLDICKTVPVAFSAALLPFFAKAAIEGKDSLKALCVSSLRYLILALLPVAVGTLFIADRIILSIYGSKFASSVPLLQLDIFALIPFSMVFILAQVLIATDNQKIDLKVNIVAAASNFLLNLILIPKFDALGAVFATMISILIFNQLQYMFIRSKLFTIEWLGLFPKALLACAGMAVVTYVLRDTYLAITIVASALVYAALLIALRALSPEELHLLKQIVRRKPREESP